MSAMTDFERRLGDWLEEGPQTVPDWLVEESLDQAHATSQLGAGLRLPWRLQRVPGWRLALGVAVLLVLLIAVAIGVGSLRDERPLRVPVSGVNVCWASEHLPAPLVLQDPLAIPDSDVRVHVEVPVEFSAGGQAIAGAIGLAERMWGLSYGYELVDGETYLVSRARGIVVADATGARTHGSLSGVPLGDTGTSFVASLRDSAGLFVRDEASVELAGRAATSAIVTAPDAPIWKHIDGPIDTRDLDCLVDFTQPSRITVVNVEGALVLVQVWAADETELRSWIPIADGMLESLQLTRG